MSIHSRKIRRLAAGLMLASAAAQSGEPISIESFAKVPDIQSVSMSADGKNLVAIVALPGSNNQETGFATWDLDKLDAGSKITPSGDRMKFIGASAMKANRALVFGRQEWTGQLGGCGEGKTTGATMTFVSKLYLTDVDHKKFEEAFTDNTRRLGVSEDIQRCLEIAGTASLVNTLPLDPDNVIISQIGGMSLSGNYYLYNLRTGETKLLFKSGGRASPGLFNPRNGELLTKSQLESIGPSEYEQRILILNPKTGEFETQATLTTKLSERYTIDIVGIDEATGKYYVLTDRFSDRVQAWMYNPSTQKYDDEPLLAHPEYSIGGLVLGTQPSNFNKVLGYVVDGPTREVTFIEPQMQGIHAMLKKAFPGQSVNINGYNDTLSRVLFSASSAQNPPSYHVLLDRKSIDCQGNEVPQVAAVHRDVGLPVRRVGRGAGRARDGREGGQEGSRQGTRQDHRDGFPPAPARVRHHIPGPGADR